VEEGKPQTFVEPDWVYRVQLPTNEAPQRLLLIIHGWTGDENSMWLFTQGLPSTTAILAPRGFVDAPSGYGWAGADTGFPTPFSALQSSVEKLLKQVDRWTTRFPSLANQALDLMGFSQGCAMTYAIMATNPQRVRRAACMAGYLPAGAERYFTNDTLVGKTVLISHGTLDETISIEYAREARRVISAAGAEIDYCEEEVGHKMGAACFRKLKTFFV